MAQGRSRILSLPAGIHTALSIRRTLDSTSSRILSLPAGLVEDPQPPRRHSHAGAPPPATACLGVEEPQPPRRHSHSEPLALSAVAEAVEELQPPRRHSHVQEAVANFRLDPPPQSRNLSPPRRHSHEARHRSPLAPRPTGVEEPQPPRRHSHGRYPIQITGPRTFCRGASAPSQAFTPQNRSPPRVLGSSSRNLSPLAGIHTSSWPSGCRTACTSCRGTSAPSQAFTHAVTPDRLAPQLSVVEKPQPPRRHSHVCSLMLAPQVEEPQPPRRHSHRPNGRREVPLCLVEEPQPPRRHSHL